MNEQPISLRQQISDLTQQLSDTRRRLAAVEKERYGAQAAIKRAIELLEKTNAERKLYRRGFLAAADSLEGRITALRNAADGLACAVGAAPHDKSCYWWPKHPRGEPGACTCWKHKALADYSALISEGEGKDTSL